MALTSGKAAAAIRKRHLRVNGEKAHVQFFISKRRACTTEKARPPQELQRNRADRGICWQRRAALILLLLCSPALAEELTDEQKADILKRAYHYNGDSMVRRKSIDLEDLTNPVQTTPVKPESMRDSVRDALEKKFKLEDVRDALEKKFKLEEKFKKERLPRGDFDRLTPAAELESILR
jgi:hypothetical protein